MQQFILMNSIISQSADGKITITDIDKKIDKKTLDIHILDLGSALKNARKLLELKYSIKNNRPLNIFEQLMVKENKLILRESSYSIGSNNVFGPDSTVVVGTSDSARYSIGSNNVFGANSTVVVGTEELAPNSYSIGSNNVFSGNANVVLGNRYL